MADGSAWIPRIIVWKKEADEVAQMMEITTADAVRIFLDGFAEEKKFPLTTKFPMQRHWLR